jgi:uptake hydrogenase small subunit
VSEDTVLVSGGGCGGDTYSFLSGESPDLLGLLRTLGISLLWHPSLSSISPQEHEALFEAIHNNSQPLDILVLEGSVICGPAGTGMFHSSDGHPKKEQIYASGLAGGDGHRGRHLCLLRRFRR